MTNGLEPDVVHAFDRSATVRGARYHDVMLDDAQIEAYRNMTPEERWRITEELMDIAWAAMLDLPEGERNRRLRIIEEEHDRSDAIMIAHLRKYS